MFLAHVHLAQVCDHDSLGGWKGQTAVKEWLCIVHMCADGGPAAAQMSYARQLITLEQRDQVLNIMQRFRLPMWHAVCHPSLFIKVCPAICTPPRQHSSANFLSLALCNLQLLIQEIITLSGRHHGEQSVATIPHQNLC